jgi:hypothetical protein
VTMTPSNPMSLEQVRDVLLKGFFRVTDGDKLCVELADAIDAQLKRRESDRVYPNADTQAYIDELNERISVLESAAACVNPSNSDIRQAISFAFSYAHSEEKIPRIAVEHILGLCNLLSMACSHRASPPSHDETKWQLVPIEYIRAVEKASGIASDHSPCIDAVERDGGDDHEDPSCAIHHILYYAGFLLPSHPLSAAPRSP